MHGQRGLELHASPGLKLAATLVNPVVPRERNGTKHLRTAVARGLVAGAGGVGLDSAAGSGICGIGIVKANGMALSVVGNPIPCSTPFKAQATPVKDALVRGVHLAFGPQKAVEDDKVLVKASAGGTMASAHRPVVDGAAYASNGGLSLNRAVVARDE